MSLLIPDNDIQCSKFLDLLGKRMNRPSLQGSVFWMAPEVVKQKAHTSKADIWSVGCLCVEMLTGEHPWAQLTQMQAIFKVREITFDIIRGLLLIRSAPPQNPRSHRIYRTKLKIS